MSMTPLKNLPSERKCLKCGKPFMSEGNHNRKCETCKLMEDWYGEPFERVICRSIPENIDHYW